MNLFSKIENGFNNVLIRFQMEGIRRFCWNPLLQATHDPQQQQQQLLLQILQDQQSTDFGKHHRFGEICSIQDFRKSVPVHHYEDLRPAIEQQEKTGFPVLNRNHPQMYAQTSGTTGAPKLIPFPPEAVWRYRKSQALVAYAYYSQIEKVFEGKILTIVSPAREGVLDSDVPFGAMSGFIQDSMPFWIRRKYILPPEIHAIKNHHQKYFLIAAFGLREPDLTFIASANPSTFISMAGMMQSRWEELIEFLKTGDPSPLGPSLEEAAKRTLEKFHPDPRRAGALQDLPDDAASNPSEIIWPNLRAIATWTHGSCRFLVPKLQSLLPSQTRIVEMGYLSSEFRGTIPVDIHHNRCLPAFNENIFEFVEKSRWEENCPEFLNLDQLESGRHYYVIATTPHGLYRYFINDLVEVDGMFNNTPTLRFIRKGRGVINLTGEKLCEEQVIDAVEAVTRKAGCSFDFFLLLGDPETIQYTLFFESPPLQAPLSEWIEEQLSRTNVEFRDKRQSGRLKKMRILFLQPGTSEKFKQHCIQQGQREGQFKFPRLLYAAECNFNFYKFVTQNASQTPDTP